MGTIAASAARMAGAADAARRLRVITSVGVGALAGAVLAARRAWHARRVTAYVVSGGSGVPVVVTPIHTAASTAGSRSRFRWGSPSRSRRTARLPTCPTPKTAR